MSRIEDKVIKRIQTRANAGLTKYGVTLERDDLSFLEWMQHLQEELLDAALYVEKLKEVAREDYEELLISMFAEEGLDEICAVPCGSVMCDCNFNRSQ